MPVDLIISKQFEAHFEAPTTLPPEILAKINSLAPEPASRTSNAAGRPAARQIWLAIASTSMVIETLDAIALRRAIMVVRSKESLRFRPTPAARYRSQVPGVP